MIAWAFAARARLATPAAQGESMNKTTRRTLQRLGRAALFSAVRAAASAAATGLITFIIWVIEHLIGSTG
jgi:hypothetical protein